MKYSKELSQIAECYNVDARTILFFQLVAIGTNKGDAYAAIFAKGKELSNMDEVLATSKANELINSNPSFAIYAERFKNKLFRNKYKSNAVDLSDNNDNNGVMSMLASEEDALLFKDKNIMTRALLKSASSLQGKERSQVLMQIAELNQLKKEEEKDVQEQRRYYLPYISHCRTCRLMQILLDLQKGNK